MSADEIIRRYRDTVADGEPVPDWFIETLIRDAWFAGHKQGLRDFREGLEAHMAAKAGETV